MYTRFHWGHRERELRWVWQILHNPKISYVFWCIIHASKYTYYEAALISPRLSRILKLSRSCELLLISPRARVMPSRASTSSTDYIIDPSLTPELISFRTRPKFLFDTWRTSDALVDLTRVTNS